MLQAIATWAAANLTGIVLREVLNAALAFVKEAMARRDLEESVLQRVRAEASETVVRCHEALDALRQSQHDLSLDELRRPGGPTPGAPPRVPPGAPPSDRG